MVSPRGAADLGKEGCGMGASYLFFSLLTHTADQTTLLADTKQTQARLGRRPSITLLLLLKDKQVKG